VSSPRETDDRTETRSEPEPTPDGGVNRPDADQRIVKQFENIKRTRRRRGIGWLVLLGIIGFISVQAANAAELLDSEPQIDTFLESLFSGGSPFFPLVSVGPVPVPDVTQYVDFILSQNLLYDPAVGDLLLEGQFYTFFIAELGMFSIFGEAGITLAMGFIGTVIGFPFALVFGTLGSERVTPFPFNFIFRGTMSFIRSVPAIVWTLIFIPFLGLGPASAAVAIAFDTTGNLGRLFVDELEEIEDGPIEAMETTGASKPQVVFFGMLSQVRTAFIAWTLYIFEINVRIAVTLGVIGAGGLGYIVTSQQNLLRFTEMMATLFAIFVLIISVELFSQRLRSRLRSDEERMGWWELIFGFPDRMADSLRR